MGYLFASSWKDYELLDAGNGKKLERWGKIVTIRPEVNAYFKPGLDYAIWQLKAHAEFESESTIKGAWKYLKPVSENWQIEFNSLVFNLRFTPFKHIGIFPEQNYNWNWLKANVKSGMRVLNLFGYTGGSSLMARCCKAEVFHCDAIKSVNDWGKKNMVSSNLDQIHWVTEDALKFSHREIKRGNKYDILLMDPPAFGISGAKKKWKIENEFKPLLQVGFELLNKNGKIILNTYSPRLTENNISDFLKTNPMIKDFRIDTLCIKSNTDKRLEYGLRTFIEIQ